MFRKNKSSKDNYQNVEPDARLSTFNDIEPKALSCLAAKGVTTVRDLFKTPDIRHKDFDELFYGEQNEALAGISELKRKILENTPDILKEIGLDEYFRKAVEHMATRVLNNDAIEKSDPELFDYSKDVLRYMAKYRMSAMISGTSAQYTNGYQNIHPDTHLNLFNDIEPKALSCLAAKGVTTVRDLFKTPDIRHKDFDELFYGEQNEALAGISELKRKILENNPNITREIEIDEYFREAVKHMATKIRKNKAIEGLDPELFDYSKDVLRYMENHRKSTEIPDRPSAAR